MSGEEFFERLKGKAYRWVGTHQLGIDIEPSLEAIDVTIEALREIMVGEPIRIPLDVHEGFTGGEAETSGWLCEIWRYDNDHASDGEEVVVMVFRDENKG